MAEAEAGDFIFVPPYVPHQEINAARDEPLECVLVRSDNEAVVVNLDIEPVEKPEARALGRPDPRVTARLTDGTMVSRRDWLARLGAALAALGRARPLGARDAGTSREHLLDEIERTWPTRQRPPAATR